MQYEVAQRPGHVCENEVNSDDEECWPMEPTIMLSYFADLCPEKQEGNGLPDQGKLVDDHGPLPARVVTHFKLLTAKISMRRVINDE